MTTTPFVFPDPGIPKIPLERVDLDSDLATHYIQTSRPFVAKVDWPALQWSPAHLRSVAGDVVVHVYNRDGDRVPVTVSQYLDLVDNQRTGTGDYVLTNAPVIELHDYFAGGVNPAFASLLPDLRLPSVIKPERIRSMRLWFKNGGWYDNRSHAEPSASANLNLQIRGKKHVWLFSPEDARYLGVASSREELMTVPFFSGTQRVYSPADDPEFQHARCYEAILEPGDVIHIPSFWFHWFVHYDAYQMNYNCWFYPDLMALSPIASEWSFMRALGVALGGFGVAVEEFAKLPVETQELLTRIARALITERGCTEPIASFKLFEGANVKVPVNTKYFPEK